MFRLLLSNEIVKIQLQYRSTIVTINDFNINPDHYRNILRQ